MYGYEDPLAVLWKYQEFQVVYETLRYGVAIIIVLLLLVLLLHLWHELGHASPLYRSRSPVRGWRKRFFPTVTVLITWCIALYWLMGEWVRRY